MKESQSDIALPDIVLFDLDGTLCAFSSAVVHATNAIARVMYARRERKGEDGQKQKAASDAPDTPKGSVMYSFGRALLRPRPMPGVEKLLRHLEDKGIGKAVVSNSSIEWGVPTLEQTGLSQYFNVLSFRTEHVQLKPSPDAFIDAIRRIEDEMQAPPKTVWAIGDMPADIEAAVNAQKSGLGYEVVPVAIGSDSPAARKLQSFQSDGQALNGLVFENYDQMLRYLKDTGTAPGNSTANRSPVSGR